MPYAISWRTMGRNMRRITLLIVAGWGACLLPFAFAPISVTLVAFAVGGLIYGPFIPLTYALFQASTSAVNLPFVLAARSAVVMVSTPLGTAIGGPLVESLGASDTLAASGLATFTFAPDARSSRTISRSPRRTPNSSGVAPLFERARAPPSNC